MKIRVEMTLDVDPEAWMEAYDVEKSEVRDHVKTYLASAVPQALREAGLLIAGC